MTTQTWITYTAGDWSTAADWVSGMVPSATDDAVINNTNTATVNGTAVANSLTLDNSELTISGTLTLGTSLTLNGIQHVSVERGNAVGTISHVRRFWVHLSVTALSALPARLAASST